MLYEAGTLPTRQSLQLQGYILGFGGTILMSHLEIMYLLSCCI